MGTRLNAKDKRETERERERERKRIIEKRVKGTNGEAHFMHCNALAQSSIMKRTMKEMNFMFEYVH